MTEHMFILSGAVIAALAAILLFARVTLFPNSSSGKDYYGDCLAENPFPGVRLHDGTLIRGILEPSIPCVRQFLGIPYAAPPVGSLRWAPPQPATDMLLAETNGTRLPVSCVQYLNNRSSIYTRDVLEFGVPRGNESPMSEDCLTLSVWTPVLAGRAMNEDQRLPVVVFIHGGSFYTGGQSVPYQIPAQWVQRSRRLIVVSFNYRLNIFGFPNAAGLNEQNLGLMDQRLAVEWVYNNIASFGGDPTQITLWGQSAGGMAVDFYNFAYYNEPIVAGLIMSSGTALVPIRSYDTGHSNFSFVAMHVGCGTTSDAAAELECMRRVPAETLEQFLRRYLDSGVEPTIAFEPIADDKIVFTNYTERALAGQLADIPAIIGTTALDGLPYAPYNPHALNQTMAHEGLLRVFACPVELTTRHRLAAGRKTYRYEYHGNFTNISPRPWMGAYHSSELPLLFGTHPNFRGNSTLFEYAVSAAMQDAWFAFSQNPWSGLAAQKWPPYAAGGPVRMFAANGTSAQTGLGALERMCNGVPVIAS